MPTLAGKKTNFPSIYSVIGRASSIFRPKMDGTNLSEVDLSPRRHIAYSLKSVFHKWEKNTYFL